MIQVKLTVENLDLVHKEIEDHQMAKNKCHLIQMKPDMVGKGWEEQTEWMVLRDTSLTHNTPAALTTIKSSKLTTPFTTQTATSKKDKEGTQNTLNE